jgi:RNA polymerase-interacting CarD/CdnL/TRCF family regulator
MQFKSGDNVVHPVYGLGRIVRIEKKKFSEKGVRQYYNVKLSTSTLWIPVEQTHVTSGLRLVTARHDLEQYRDLLQSAPLPLENDKPQLWHKELNHRLKQWTFPAMCEVVRDLTALDGEKPLGATNKTILRKTQEKLYQEWATAADISVAEAAEEIQSLLRTAQKTD